MLNNYESLMLKTIDLKTDDWNMMKACRPKVVNITHNMTQTILETKFMQDIM